MTEHTTLSCARCGVDICLSPTQLGQLKRTGDAFYCVNGHGNVFNGGRSEADTLRDQLAKAEKSRDDWMKYARQQEALVRSLELSNRGLRGVTAKARKARERESA